jgi:oligopeptide/dipeptide ABC transporter ATP-binding protein
MLIESRNLRKLFPIGRRLLRSTDALVHAVDNVSISIPHGRTLALVGESGSGKTTLGRLFAGLIEPTEGLVYFEGKDLFATSADERRKIRSQLQFIFQDPYSSLNPRHNVRSILARPFEIHTNLSKEEIDKNIIELLRSVGLTPPEALLYRYPHQFSGGQRQRLVFARAIALHPKFIVADEPVSSLDMSVKAQLLTLLRRFQNELELTYLFITHELSVARTIAADIAVMYLGEIVEYASTAEFFSGPLHPYSQALLNATPILNPLQARQRERILLSGDMPSPVNPPSGCRFHTRCPYAQAICSVKEPLLRKIGSRWVSCHFVGQPDFPLTANLDVDLQLEAKQMAENFPSVNMMIGYQ